MVKALTSPYVRNYLPVTEEEENSVIDYGLLVLPKGSVMKPLVIIWDDKQGLNCYGLFVYGVGEVVARYSGYWTESKERSDCISSVESFSFHALNIGEKGQIDSTPRICKLPRLAAACAVGGIVASSRKKHNKSRPGNLEKVPRLTEAPVPSPIGDGIAMFHGIDMTAREVIDWGSKLHWDYDFASYGGGALSEDEAAEEAEAYAADQPTYIMDIITKWRKNFLDSGEFADADVQGIFYCKQNMLFLTDK